MRFTNRSRSMKAWTVAAAVVLAGCGGSDGSDATTAAGSVESTSTTSAPVVETPVVSRTITVDAVGEAAGRPDEMKLALGVEIQGERTTTVLDEVGALSTSLREFLLAQGIPEAQLQTTQLSVYPMYGGYMDGQLPSIVSYSASVTMTVSTSDLPTASRLVDGAALVVGDALRVHGLTWSMSNTEELTATARTEAVGAARTQAAELAAAGGLTLGEIVSVSETSNSPYGYGMGEGDGGSIPFDPGTGSVRVFVSVTFEAS